LPWDSAEDIVLLAYWYSGQTVAIFDFLKELACALKPGRTTEAIQSRLLFLSNLSDPERDLIIENWAHQTRLERRLFKSFKAESSPPGPAAIRPPQTEQCHCLEWTPPGHSLNSNVDTEIARLTESLDALSSELFSGMDLTILRGERVQF
jgi:hypothetical protein